MKPLILTLALLFTYTVVHNSIFYLKENVKELPDKHYFYSYGSAILWGFFYYLTH